MIRVENAHLDISIRTHPGAAGKENEDRFAVSAYRVEAIRTVPSVFAMLADGIGGHRSGEVAAEMAVAEISKSVAESDGEEPVAILRKSIRSASQSIAARAKKDTRYQGMGTTCACAWIIDRRLYTASVGDSRIYLLRDSRLQQLTTDHTWVREAIDKGLLDAKQALQNPNQHVIRRFLGSSRPPEVDVRMRLHATDDDARAEANQGFALVPGDRLLLCTDGLTDELSHEEVRDIMIGRGPLSFLRRDLDTITRNLVQLANAHGGHDNISVILLQVPGIPPRKRKFLSWLGTGGKATAL